MAGKPAEAREAALPAVYAPHLNTIERLWGVMHAWVAHNRHYATFDAFAATIFRLLPKNTAGKPDQVPGYRNRQLPGHLNRKLPLDLNRNIRSIRSHEYKMIPLQAVWAPTYHVGFVIC